MREISKSAANDLELVTAIKKTEGREKEVAFNALFNKYNDSMVFHFRGLVKNDEEIARELVLEAFMKVSSNIERFNQETAVFSTWLFKLTQNLFIDKYLRKKKLETISLTTIATYDEESRGIEYDIASEDGTPETKILLKERNKKINSIINSMKNPELAEIVKMRFFDGMSYEEIVVATGKPLNTVKAFLFRAKQILRKDFEKANVSL